MWHTWNRGGNCTIVAQAVLFTYIALHNFVVIFFISKTHATTAG